MKGIVTSRCKARALRAVWCLALIIDILVTTVTVGSHRVAARQRENTIADPMPGRQWAGAALYLPALLRAAALAEMPGTAQSTSIYACCIVRLEQDVLADGLTDTVQTKWYDRSGLVIASEYDEDADGVGDMITYWIRDADGRIRLSMSDRNHDGVIDDQTVCEYGNGEFLRLTTTYLTSESIRPPGSRQSHEWMLNAQGDVIIERIDGEGDGVWDETTQYWYDYDVEGRVLRLLGEWPGDGKHEVATTFIWSDELLLREAYDDGADGTIDATVTYAYYPDRQLASAYDSDYRRTTRYYYDERGWFHRKETYYGPRLSDYAEVTYDNDGRPTEGVNLDHYGVLTRWRYEFTCLRSTEPYATATPYRAKPSVPQLPREP